MDFKAKLAFFRSLEQSCQNKSILIKETSKRNQESSNIAKKINMFNNLKIPLGQPAEIKKKNHSEYQADEDLPPQLVFPPELLTRHENNVKNDENNGIPVKRTIRYSSRRRPTNISEP